MQNLEERDFLNARVSTQQQLFMGTYMMRKGDWRGDLVIMLAQVRSGNRKTELLAKWAIDSSHQTR